MEKQDKPEPAYWAVIPASVRYDKNIPSGAKLLFGEISSLCNKKGYCWAGNAYFAELYNASERTIINWINSLKESGHIAVSYKYVPGKKEVESRIIRLSEPFKPQSGKNTENPEETAPEGSTEHSEVVKNSSPPGENNFTTYGKNLHEVVKIPSKGGEKNFSDNTTSNIKFNTATASGNPETDEEPLPTVENAAAALSPEEIKKIFLAADNRLIFDSAFYNKALIFMADKGLEIKYILWLRDQCEKKDYRDFKSLYYSLFLNDSFAEEFIISTAAEEKIAEKPAKPHVCPACNAALGTTDKECPECKLSTDFPSPEQIELHKELIKLKPDKRTEYLNMEGKIYSEYKKDFVKLKQNIKNLKHEYGIVTS